MKYRQTNKSWEEIIAASRNEQIPQLDIRRKIRERIITDGISTPEGMLEYLGSIFTVKPLKYAILGLLLISVSSYAAIITGTDEQSTRSDPVASFLIDSNFSVSNES